MGYVHRDRLRIKRYQLPTGEVISVNTNYRPGVGFRAIIRGQAGKFGDSTNSVEEAIGNLLSTWVLNESAAAALGKMYLETSLEEVK